LKKIEVIFEKKSLNTYPNFDAGISFHLILLSTFRKRQSHTIFFRSWKGDLTRKIELLGEEFRDLSTKQNLKYYIKKKTWKEYRLFWESANITI
jgi:hypothetical protein